MAKINRHYQKLQAGYLFPEVAKRVRVFADQHPNVRIIRLGIGDVVLPLPHPIVEALQSAADEMGRKESFRGYGPEQGYDFLRSAIAAHYAGQGAQVDEAEIFVDGCGHVAASAGALDRVCAGKRDHHPVRRRIRGVHSRATVGAQHLRAAWGARGRHRVP